MARTEDEIERDTVDALIGDVRLSLRELNVVVSGGTVTLRGVAPSLYQKCVAEQVASRIKGVSAVVNELLLGGESVISDEDIMDSILSSLERDALVPEEQVSVIVHNGIVHLSGTVDSLLARSSAEDDARLVSGVKGIVNEIDVVREPQFTDLQIASDVSSALLRELLLGPSEIVVSVEKGVVTLKGSVSTADRCRMVAEVARRVPGVLGVRNHVFVVS